MPIYTLDIDCRSSRHDYGPLFDRLRQIQAQSFMGTRWLIDVREDLNVVTKAILGECAEGDGVFVTELASETRWTGTGLGQEAKAWLLARMTPAAPVPEPSQATAPARMN